MDQLYVGLTAVGCLLLGVGLLSGPIKGRLWVSQPLISLGFGVVLGPSVLGWLVPSRWGGNTHHLIEEAARLTLGIGLMAVALRIPARYTRRHGGPLGVVLAGVMPLMWLTSGVLVHGVLGLGWTESLLVAAVITPTDPIVASSIVTGVSAHRNLPGRLRHLLSAESGFNDGLGYLIVLLPVLLWTRPTGEALSHWATHSLLREVVGGALLGGVLGWTAGKALCLAEKRHWVEQTSFLVFTVALSLLVLGVARLLEMDGILAVFISGMVLDNVVGGGERAKEAGIQEAVSQFFNLPIFVLLGLALPWQQWWALGWQGLALAVAVLLLRRLPAVLLLRRWIRPLYGWPDSLFYGWFGPIGVSAIFYAMLARRHGAPESVWSVGSLVICASLLAHGVTATPLTRQYGQREFKKASDDS